MKRGIILGTLSLTILSGVAILAYFTGTAFLAGFNNVRQRTDQRGALFALRKIRDEEERHHSARGQYASLDELRASESGRKACDLFGRYHYNADLVLSADRSAYEIRLAPTWRLDDGLFFFFSSTDGQTRYTAGTPAGPTDTTCCSDY